MVYNTVKNRLPGILKHLLLSILFCEFQPILYETTFLICFWYLQFFHQDFLLLLYSEISNPTNVNIVPIADIIVIFSCRTITEVTTVITGTI